MYNKSFDVWLKDEVKDILKANYVDKSLSTDDFLRLVIEVKKEYQECDSPEEVNIEDLVNYIFESSSYKDKMWVIYPEEHKYAGQQRPLIINS
jgi:hypothetical protein|tara:strand:- start:505 stop:783 length:279 start_codon:yes stop_codon:yes gene_type:complete